MTSFGLGGDHLVLELPFASEIGGSAASGVLAVLTFGSAAALAA